jgi:phosphoribosylformylglycinamidine synthase I
VIAKELRSFAQGPGVIAEGLRSLAQGPREIAEVAPSLAYGPREIAEGLRSFAWGPWLFVDGARLLALGARIEPEGASVFNWKGSRANRMAAMRACVVVFPGSNADTEMIHTLRDVCGSPTVVIWHDTHELPAGIDLVAIPGGFAYGDYLRCGAIAKVSPVVPAIRAHADRGGYVLGVCNGFQILTEVGLLPGALTRNLHMRFECGDIHVKLTAGGAFTKDPGKVWRLPIAHGDGRYQATPDVLARLEDRDEIGMRYCTESGEVSAASNPNGSVGNIAGIYGGPKKNVFGLMPHPERMSEAVLGGADGRKLFESVLLS